MRNLLRRSLALSLGLALAGACWAQAKPEDKKTEGGKAEVGKPAPGLELKGTDGKTYKLSDLKDKTVVVEWTSKDCGAGSQIVGSIKELSDAYMKKGVVWLAVDSSHYRKIEDNVQWIKDKKLGYPILDDREGKVGKAWGIKNTCHFLVVRQGQIVYSGAPFTQDGSKKYLADALDAALGNKEVKTSATRPFG